MEQFLTNIELVTNMCKFLNYEEQLKLTQVSSQLRKIIVNHVWNIKLDKIEITMMGMSFVVSDTLKEFKDVRDNFLERDILRKNSFILTSKNLNIFLNLNMENIKKLQLTKNNRECDAYESIKNALPFRKKFPNLNELCCWNIKFEDMDLQQVAVNCAKLETLILINCSNLKGELLEIGLGIDIEILKDMQNLNNLCIFTGEYTFSIIKNILNQLKLEQLTLLGAIVNDSKNNNNDLNLRNLKYYKALNMPSFEDNSQLLYFQTNLLPHLENLCNLRLRSHINISITKEFFNVLLESCKSLTHLDLYEFTINDFIALPSLNELNLEFCKGLTYSHLKTILSEMHLKSFNSRWIKYEGNFECFPISPSLQKIEMKLYDNNLIKLFEFNKANLMNLTEFHHDACEMLRVSNFAKNLKVLNIEHGTLFAEDCLKLQHLQEISLYGIIDISDFLLLLKHENLQKLSIGLISYFSDQKSLDLKEMKTFHTNLRYLQMTSYNKEFIFDILLDLLNMNTKLSFALFIVNVEPITQVLSHEKFPNRFKNVKFCGASIDCNSIRNQCVATMGQIETLIEDFLKFHFVPYFLLK